MKNGIESWLKCTACSEVDPHSTGRLAETGLVRHFILALGANAAVAMRQDGMQHPFEWCLFHADARQHAEAILAAAQEGP